MKSKKITIDQVQQAYNVLRRAQKDKEQAEINLAAIIKEFDNLVNRTSQQVLAQFVREGEI